jgi:hypothetical protein
VSWRVVFTRQAQKDAKKLAGALLKSKTEKLLELLGNPFETPPPYEKFEVTCQEHTRGESTSSTALFMKSTRTRRWSR